MAALVLCYVLYFRSAPLPAEAGSDEPKVIAVAPVHASGDLQTASMPHSVYKADLDRAHAAARQMQAAHADANAY